LLVVISIVALLMAILLPTLQRVRKQGQAVKCQGILRQWGLYYSMYTAENDYKMPSFYNRSGMGIPGVLPEEFFADPRLMKDESGRMVVTGYGILLEGRELLLCPATRVQPPEPGRPGAPCQNGTSRLAWSYAWSTQPKSGIHGSSYGQNMWIIPWTREIENTREVVIWPSCLMKGAGEVPVYSDCRGARVLPGDQDRPPPYEDAPVEAPWDLQRYVINRHNGGINSLFMDWSARKVGLKELWMLKWSERFDRASLWTKAGGVRPEDWPVWMRKFKDY
jgi:prepilin-type processing-associated H-X9-DG protein